MLVFGVTYILKGSLHLGAFSDPRLGCVDPVSRKKIMLFHASRCVFGPIPTSRMMFAQFESRIPQNVVTNPESH